MEVKLSFMNSFSEFVRVVFVVVEFVKSLERGTQFDHLRFQNANDVRLLLLIEIWAEIVELTDDKLQFYSAAMNGWRYVQICALAEWRPYLLAMQLIRVVRVGRRVKCFQLDNAD